MAMIREFFQNLLYQVPCYRDFRYCRCLLVVSIIFYSLLRLIHPLDERSARGPRDLMLLAITLLTDVLNLYTLNWLLSKILEVGAIALIVCSNRSFAALKACVGAQLHFPSALVRIGRDREQSAISPRCGPARSCRVSVSASC